MVNAGATTNSGAASAIAQRDVRDRPARKTRNQKLGIFTKYFGDISGGSTCDRKHLADFRHFLNLARLLQTCLAWPGDGPPVGSGRYKMTFNLTSLQQLAVSLVGAVFAASLFVSAAVGPVGQFI
jgi:hypothetical protein